MINEPIKLTIYEGESKGFYTKENFEKFLNELENSGKLSKIGHGYYFSKEYGVTLNVFFESKQEYDMSFKKSVEKNITLVKAYGFEREKLGEVEKLIKEEEKKHKKE